MCGLSDPVIFTTSKFVYLVFHCSYASFHAQSRRFSRKLNSLCLCFSVVDTNDRFLRKITVGQASTEKGQIREVCSIHAHNLDSSEFVMLYIANIFLSLAQYDKQWCHCLSSIAVVLLVAVIDMGLKWLLRWHEMPAFLGTHAVKLESIETFPSTHTVKLPSISSLVHDKAQMYFTHMSVIMTAKWNPVNKHFTSMGSKQS